MSEGRGRMRRTRVAAAALAILVVAGCGPDVVAPTTGADASADPGSSAEVPGAAGAPSAPSASDPVTGTFRRGGVPVPPELLGSVVAACRAVPTPADVQDIGRRTV